MANLNDFAPNPPGSGCFIVKHIGTDPRKVIKIFNYPIPFGKERNLLEIPGVAESDIRASLLKGELRHKILCQEIEVVCNTCDLLQFDPVQKQFLENAGITNGLDVKAVVSTLPYLWREEIVLIGLKNGTNRTFFTPDKFLNGNFITGDRFHIHVKHNGKDLYEGIDYTIGESSGPGTGYDTINLISFTPNAHSLLYATYAIKV